MVEKIAIFVSPTSGFKVVVMDRFGGQRVVGQHSHILDECLIQAASSLGHDLIIPIAGPTTTL